MSNLFAENSYKIQISLLFLFFLAMSCVSTMLEIGPRPWMKKKLINCIDHVIELFKCDLLSLSLSQISD